MKQRSVLATLIAATVLVAWFGGCSSSSSGGGGGVVGSSGGVIGTSGGGSGGNNGKGICSAVVRQALRQRQRLRHRRSGQACCDFGGGKVCAAASSCPRFCTSDQTCNTAEGRGLLARLPPEGRPEAVRVQLADGLRHRHHLLGSEGPRHLLDRHGLQRCEHEVLHHLLHAHLHGGQRVPDRRALTNTAVRHASGRDLLHHRDRPRALPQQGWHLPAGHTLSEGVHHRHRLQRVGVDAALLRRGLPGDLPQVVLFGRRLHDR